MSTIQHRVRLVDNRGAQKGRVEIASGVGDEDLVILEARRPRFNDTPVEVQLLLPRKELLKALGAEPDETDYAEVLAENSSLGLKLSKTLRERDTAVKDRDAAERERDSALEALRDAAEAPEDAPEEPREDQDQIDRSWALERAGEVLWRLAAVGGLPKGWAGLPVIAVAEWILAGKPVDRG